MNEAVQILWDLKKGDLACKEQAVKQAAVFALERSYFPEAVPALLELLENEPTAKIAEEAAWALWKFKDPRAIPVLLKKAETGLHLSVREKSIRSLGLLQAGEVLPLLKKILKSCDENPVLKKAAIAALGHFEEREGMAILQKCLKDKNIVIRQEALQSLGRFLRRNPKPFSDAVLKPIRKWVSWRRERAEEVRREALRCLSYSLGDKKRPLFEKSARKDPSSKVRALALSLLSAWPDAATEEIWLKGLEDVAWPVRYAAGELLVKAFRDGRICDKVRTAEAVRKIVKMFPSFAQREII